MRSSQEFSGDNRGSVIATNRIAQRGSVGAGGEAMEQAIKHTYICGTDEWFSERTEVSIAARSFAAGRLLNVHVGAHAFVNLYYGD